MTDAIREVYRRFLDIKNINKADAVLFVVYETHDYALLYVSVPELKTSYYLNVSVGPCTSKIYVFIYKFEECKTWDSEANNES